MSNPRGSVSRPKTFSLNLASSRWFIASHSTSSTTIWRVGQNQVQARASAAPLGNLQPYSVASPICSTLIAYPLAPQQLSPPDRLPAAGDFLRWASRGTPPVRSRCRSGTGGQRLLQRGPAVHHVGEDAERDALDALRASGGMATVLMFTARGRNPRARLEPRSTLRCIGRSPSVVLIIIVPLVVTGTRTPRRSGPCRSGSPRTAPSHGPGRRSRRCQRGPLVSVAWSTGCPTGSLMRTLAGSIVVHPSPRGQGRMALRSTTPSAVQPAPMRERVRRCRSLMWLAPTSRSLSSVVANLFRVQHISAVVMEPPSRTEENHSSAQSRSSGRLRPAFQTFLQRVFPVAGMPGAISRLPSKAGPSRAGRSRAPSHQRVLRSGWGRRRPVSSGHTSRKRRNGAPLAQSPPTKATLRVGIFSLWGQVQLRPICNSPKQVFPFLRRQGRPAL